MNPLYETIPVVKPPRNVFNLTHSNKFTMRPQLNYPTLVMEVLPGDRHLVFSELFARAQPLVAPVFQNYTISQHAFFVPMRTMSNNWEQFITGGREGDFNSVMPYTYLENLYNGLSNVFNSVMEDDPILPRLANCIRLFDFIGLPFRYNSSTDVYTFVSDFVSDNWNSSLSTSQVPVNLIPFYAYQKIWSEYYRDENIVDDIIKSIDEVLNFKDLVGYQSDVEFSFTSWIDLFVMRPRAWKKDRFTSALPFTQRGPDVLLPIAGTAPVDSYIFATNTQPVGGDVTGTSAGPLGKRVVVESLNSFNIGREVDFSEAELTTTINDFRRAERLQRWYENSARGGARLNENTLAHWGVRTPDSTLDRAVFLGGCHQPIVISEVEQNSSTTSTSPQGNLAGKGTSYNSDRLFKHYDSEHGIIIVLSSILMHADYWQGVPKIFTRQDRFDYAWPEFANLGEEPVYTRELYAKSSNTEVFGYTPRYSDYKSMPNELHGDMRSSLDFWSLPRVFAEKPTLSNDFIYNPASVSPFAVASEYSDPFVVVVNFNIKSSRLLPFYGVPTI